MTIIDSLENKREYIKLALPKESGYEVLNKILDDGDYDANPRYCAIQPNITAELTVQGIGGLRTFQCFLIRNLPEPYSHRNIVFQIVNIIDNIESGTWDTTIVAGLRPGRKFLYDRLGIKLNEI